MKGPPGPGVRPSTVNILGGSPMGMFFYIPESFFLSSPQEGREALLGRTQETGTLIVEEAGGGEKVCVPGSAPTWVLERRRAPQTALQCTPVLRVWEMREKQETRGVRGSGQQAGGAGRVWCPGRSEDRVSIKGDHGAQCEVMLMVHVGGLGIAC